MMMIIKVLCVCVCKSVKDHSVSDNDDADEKTRLRPSVSDVIKAPTSGLPLH